MTTRVLALIALVAPSLASAQGKPAAAPKPTTPTTTSTQAAPQVTATSGEAEFLVAPQGGAFEVPLHTGEVCLLLFPDELAPRALTSSAAFEIKAWGDDGVAVRASSKTEAATVALSTTNGKIKVNLTLRTVSKAEPALTMVKFKPVSYEEAVEAQISAGIAKRIGPIEAEVMKAKKEIDARIRDRADALTLDRILRRNQVVEIESHGRNDDGVIVHVHRGQLLGPEGYIVFEIQNRSRTAYRVGSVRVTSEGRNVAGPARVASTTTDVDPDAVGVVAAGTTARGAVSVRSVDEVLGKSLALEVAGPGGRDAVRLDRGIVLR